MNPAEILQIIAAVADLVVKLESLSQAAGLKFSGAIDLPAILSQIFKPV